MKFKPFLYKKAINNEPKGELNELFSHLNELFGHLNELFGHLNELFSSKNTKMMFSYKKYIQIQYGEKLCGFSVFFDKNGGKKTLKTN